MAKMWDRRRWCLIVGPLLLRRLDRRLELVGMPGLARRDSEEQEALGVLEDRDRNRDEYHRVYYERVWSDPTNYHMVLNTELLGVEGSADVIVAQARKLGW